MLDSMVLRTPVTRFLRARPALCYLINMFTLRIEEYGALALLGPPRLRLIAMVLPASTLFRAIFPACFGFMPPHIPRMLCLDLSLCLLYCVLIGALVDLLVGLVDLCAQFTSSGTVHRNADRVCCHTPPLALPGHLDGDARPAITSCRLG